MRDKNSAPFASANGGGEKRKQLSVKMQQILMLFWNSKSMRLNAYVSTCYLAFKKMEISVVNKKTGNVKFHQVSYSNSKP